MMLLQQHKTVIIILTLLFPNIPKSLITKHVKFICKMTKDRGPKHVIQYLSVTEDYIMDYILGNSIRGKQGIRMKTNRVGYPTWLGVRLKSKLFNNDDETTRYLLSLTKLRKLITFSSITNLSSITGKLAGKGRRLSSFFSEVRKAKLFPGSPGISKIRLPMHRVPLDELIQKMYSRVGDDTTEVFAPKYYFSCKSGPNGVSCLTRIADSLAVLRHPSLKYDLQKFLNYSVKGIGEDYVQQVLQKVDCVKEKSNTKLNLGKISLTHENGKLKPRVFAIIDGITQQVLKPYHETLMKDLKTIPEDCTTDHSVVAVRAKEVWNDGNRFYGWCDLSDATDAFPKEVYRFFGNMDRDGMGNAWVKLFDREFALADSVKNAWDECETYPKSIKYGTGQPMGALSSWPAFARCHHRVVWTAAGSRTNATGKYLLLGDDIVIFDRELFDRYIRLIKILGIKHKPGTSRLGFEFAKRTFVRGNEFTGVYMNALISNRQAPLNFLMEWANLASRGYNIPTLIPSVLWKIMSSHSYKGNVVNKKITISLTKRNRIQEILRVPRSPNVTDKDFALWIMSLTGQSGCQMNTLDAEQSALKPFRQASSVCFQMDLIKVLKKARETYKDFGLNLWEEMTKHNFELYEDDLSLSEALRTNHIDILESREVNLRLLERDRKRLIHGDGLSAFELMRPVLPDEPYPLVLRQHRDKLTRIIEWRALHQTQIIHLLKLNTLT